MHNGTPTTSHLLQYGFFTFLYALALVLAFLIFKPFLPAIFLALILAVAFNPLHARVRAAFRGRDTLAALSTVFIIVALILAPLTFFAYLLFGEATALYDRIATGGGVAGIAASFESALRGIEAFLPEGMRGGLVRYADLTQYAEAVVRWVAQNIGSLFASVIQTSLYVVLVVFALYYFLREGQSLSRTIVQLSPLKNAHDEMILRKISVAINTVFRGRLAVGAIQGAFAGVGFAAFGVPNPVFLAFLTAFASLVPSVGTMLVIFPAVLYLFLAGSTVPAVGLLAWGAIAVGFIDNIAGPFLIEREMKIHPFLILVSVIGGVQLFGAIGFIAGPVVLAVLAVLTDIYILLTRRVEESASNGDES